MIQKKHLLALAFVLSAAQAWAQQPRVRFIDDVYGTLKVTKGVVYGANIPYASNDPQQLKMDVYEPLGDTMAKRPVVILIHAGSFLNDLGFTGLNPFGNLSDNWLVEACSTLARKGYVAIAMTHRKGWDPTLLEQEDRARSIMQAVWRAQQDFRACVRYLRQNAATENRFKIHSGHIAAGGSSSGAYVVIHSQVIDKPAEINYEKFLDQQGKSFLDTLKLGNFDGIKTDNNKGSSLNVEALAFSSKIPLMMSFGGAVGDVNFIEPGDPVVIAAHGVNDPTTPYKTATVFTAATNQPVIEVSGGYDMTRVSKEKGNQASLVAAGFNDLPFPGLKPFSNQEFEFYNWYNSSTPQEVTTAKVYLDSIIKFVTPRMKAVLQLPTLEYENMIIGRDEKTELARSLKIYPVPARGAFSFRLEERPVTVELYTPDGKSLRPPYRLDETGAYRVDASALSAGTYVLKIETQKGAVSQHIVLE